MLTGCMAFLTFMAAFKEMLSKHVQADQYTSTIAATSILPLESLGYDDPCSLLL